MSRFSKKPPASRKISLLDLALDADYPAHPSRTLITAARRANKSGQVFMSMPRWAHESGQKIATARKHRDSFIRDGILIDIGKRRSGIRVFRLDATKLAQIQKRPFREAQDGPRGESEIDPLNPKLESKEKRAARTPVEQRILDYDKECGVSGEVRELLKMKFASNASKFDCLIHLDDPILRIVTASAVDAIWLREQLPAINRLVCDAGILVSAVVVEIASRAAQLD